MSIYPKRRDKLAKMLDNKELVEFAREGGTPKGAPICYGSFFSTKTIRQARTCNTCDDTLQEMCKQYAHFLKRLVRANEIALEEAKPYLLDEYEARAKGYTTTVDLMRKKFKAK